MQLLIAKIILTLSLAASSLLHTGSTTAPAAQHSPVGAKPLDTPVAHP